MEKQNIPLVRLGDVATWLRAGDRFRHEGREHTVEGVRGAEMHSSVFDDIDWTTPLDTPVELLSPRLELVPVGGVVKAGTPWACYAGTWSRFGAERHDVHPLDFSESTMYQLIRDEPEQLPREVVAGPETLRAGDVVEFVCDAGGYLNPRWNEGAPHRLVERDGSGWLVAGWEHGNRGAYRVPDGWTVRLLSRANQDPPAAEAQPEAVAPKPERPSACCWCEQPFGPYRRASGNPFFCADCRPGREPLDARIATARRELAESAPDPHAHLTPAQRYHLLDDPDASGIPEGN